MNGTYQKRNRDFRGPIEFLRSLFQKRTFRRLSTRLLFTLTMLAALPLVAVGLFMTSVTEDSLSEYIKNQHREIVRRAGNEIKLFLETPNTILKTLLESNDIIEMNPFVQNLILNKVISSHPIFNRIFTVDTQGNENTTTAFTHHPGNYREAPFFESAIRGKSYFSRVYFNTAKEPYVFTAFPIYQFDRIVGVLVGEIDLKSIWDLVDEITIGERGIAFVIGSNGQLIAHPDKKKVLEGAVVIDPLLLRDLKSGIHVSKEYADETGEHMLGTFAQLEETGWVIVIQQPADEAYAVVKVMRFQVFGFVGLVIFVAVFIAYVLEKRITAPIKTLVGGVKRYAEGDLNYRIDINRYEEIAVLAEEFNSMAERLLENQQKLRTAERLAAMSKFAALISHEIRNPLNSMNINMQILKREIENPQGNFEKKTKYFEIIASEIRRVDNLINNFLMISRPPRFDFLPNDINEILEEVLLIYTAKAEQQGVQIERRYAKKQILANVDRDQLKQVFHNIIINALQAMPGGGKLTIRTRERQITNQDKQKVSGVRIHFIDTGVGIPQEKIRDIFEFYYTSKKTGTGLGLAIARQIIEGHLGTIGVDSVQGNGTTIVVDIPLKATALGIKKEPMVKSG